MDRASPPPTFNSTSAFLALPGSWPASSPVTATRQIDVSRCTVAVGLAGFFPIALGVVHATAHLRTMSLRSSPELRGMTRKTLHPALIHQSEHSIA